MSAERAMVMREIRESVVMRAVEKLLNEFKWKKAVPRDEPSIGHTPCEVSAIQPTFPSVWPIETKPKTAMAMKLMMRKAIKALFIWL